MEGLPYFEIDFENSTGIAGAGFRGLSGKQEKAARGRFDQLVALIYLFARRLWKMHGVYAARRCGGCTVHDEITSH
jgi:hypothetical protein